MSQKRIKQLRRQLKKHNRGLTVRIWNEMCDYPFRRRVKWAWRLVRGRNIV